MRESKSKSDWSRRGPACYISCGVRVLGQEIRILLWSYSLVEPPLEKTLAGVFRILVDLCGVRDRVSSARVRRLEVSEFLLF